MTTLSMSEIQTLVGERFGMLRVVAFSGRIDGVLFYQCVCDCGVEKDYRRLNLRNGSTVSCGCARASRFVGGMHQRTHGLRHAPEYGVWRSMKKRCHFKSDKAFKDYGGRGIVVCEQWRSSFEQFYADMGPRPSAKHSIERLDNNGNYEPGNCCWALGEQQCNNKRSNRRLTVNGETATVAQWSRRTGTPASRIYMRKQIGWTDRAAVMGPMA